MKKSRYVQLIFSASLLTLLVLPAFAEAQVYRWVDEKGVIHFSDRPLRKQESTAMSVSGPAPTSPSDRLPTAAPAKAMKRIHVPLSTILSPREADRLRKYGINPDQPVPLMLDSVY
jgi:hypothetical protein